MKKRMIASLLPIVVMLPALAQAAQVQVYGVVDMGLSMARASGNGPNAADGSWSYAMKSGMRNSSRIGFRGVEELGGNTKVGFILENQFKADTGELQTANTLWEREASVWVSGDWGKVTAGRLGKLRSPVGSTGLFTTNNVNPFGNSMSSFVGGHKTVTAGDYFPHNNSIVYASPKFFNGWEMFAQYSFGDKDDAGEMDDNDRYMALATRYFSGPFKATLVVDTIDKANSSDRSEQPSTITAAVNYDFGWVQPFAVVQYFHSSPLNSVGADAQRGYMSAKGNYSGWGGMLTLRAPLAGGLAKVGMGYMNAKPEDKAVGGDVTRTTVSVGYDYKVSKTLDLYMDAGYVQQRSDTATGTWTLRGTEVLIGCVKFF